MTDKNFKCNICGVCCNLFLITLTESEYNSKKYKTQFEKFGLIKNFNKAEQCGANILQQKKDNKENENCIYLINNKCSIHKNRPEACRDFFCDSKEEKFKEMIKDINKSKKVLKII